MSLENSIYVYVWSLQNESKITYKSPKQPFNHENVFGFPYKDPGDIVSSSRGLRPEHYGFYGPLIC